MDLPVGEGIRAVRLDLQGEARFRRTLFFGATLISAALATALMFDIISANGRTTPELLGVPLFFVLFTWISGSFWNALAGFLVRIGREDTAFIDAAKVKDAPLRTRTALVMCIYNEDVERVFAGVNAIWESLQKEAEQKAFDFFILSDTRKPEIAEAEEAAWAALVARHNANGRIFYRRRAKNVGRKAGNIADFVRNWGGHYECMVVLDADSVMAGSTLVTLARLMEAHPQVGIMQTHPVPVGRTTLFARIIQFAARLNGPMLASGLAFWQLGESNYWGHNAIIRVRAFADNCALPRLPGREPLGGEILSHDFVEAALIRRAGYEVWMLPDLEGSWENVPSNVADFAARDLRWAQGNLQHLRVLFFRGLHWMSRTHLVTGVLAYVTSPLWLMVLLLSTLVTCLEAIQGHQYFTPGTYTLFPDWPESRAAAIAVLLLLTLAFLLLPKVLASMLALRDPSMRAQYGGGSKLMLSVLGEQLFSMLLAPAMMMFHTTFVVSTLAGKVVKWEAQPRGDRGLTWSEAVARHKWHVVTGIAWAFVIMTYAPKFIWWMMPVIAGLVLAPAISVFSSQTRLGEWARRRGLFLTPEEIAPPQELAAVEAGVVLQTGAGQISAPIAVPAFAPLRMEVASPAMPATQSESIRTAREAA